MRLQLAHKTAEQWRDCQDKRELQELHAERER
jgi:hypothetical protein